MTLTDPYTVRDLNITVNLTHGRYADLKFELIGPSGPNGEPPLEVLLCNVGGLSGSGTKTFVFDDEGARGTIRPVQPLSSYDGTSIQGTWMLRITDMVKNNKTGSLTSWTLTVVPETP